METHVKLLFSYQSSGKQETESLWAIPIHEGYKIDNIPFYVREIALGDVVSAEQKGGALYFSGLVAPSGHSTVRLWFAKTKIQAVQEVRHFLRERGCPSELSDLPRLVAVDIPPEIDYHELRIFFDDGERAGMFEYEEACFGF